MSDWTDSLQQASFRGLPFGVLGAQARFGRRLAVHEYPNRDTPWPEDMGRKTRRFVVQGFLVTNSAIYGGGDVIAQRDAMIGAAEAKGSAELVHPTFGRMTVSLEDLDVRERWDAGRYFEIAFTFVEAGQKQFPSTSSATSDAVNAAADGVSSAIGADFSSALSAVLPQVANLGALTSQAGRFAASVETAAADATSLSRLATQLSGNFGRFAGGGTSAAGISGLIATATSLRGAVTAAAAGLTTAMSGLGVGGQTPGSIAGAAATLAASLRASAASPADGVRLLTSLASFGR